MKAISGKDFAKLLEKKGWELGRTKGSHHIYAKAGHPAQNRFVETPYEGLGN